MDGSVDYELCEVDEVEGRLSEYPNRMNLVWNDRCVKIRHGNPTVDIDPNFVNATDLHVLDLSSDATAITPINVEQTLGGDLLLETSQMELQASTCASFPTPYDNDHRGGDANNPKDEYAPSRFDPTSPSLHCWPTARTLYMTAG